MSATSGKKRAAAAAATAAITQQYTLPSSTSTSNEHRKRSTSSRSRTRREQVEEDQVEDQMEIDEEEETTSKERNVSQRRTTKKVASRGKRQVVVEAAEEEEGEDEEVNGDLGTGMDADVEDAVETTSRTPHQRTFKRRRVTTNEADAQMQESEQENQIPTRKSTNRRSKPTSATSRRDRQTTQKSQHTTNGYRTSKQVEAVDQLSSESEVEEKTEKDQMNEHHDNDDEINTDNEGLHPELGIDLGGEAKIDADGRLLGGREFDFPVFTLPTRHPTRLYAMSITIARLLGYRDSNHLFVANPSLRRIPTTQDERDLLVEKGLVRPRLRQRPINIISTRALFRYFGHLIMKRGRRVHDDYYCTGKTPPTPEEEAAAIAEWEERDRQRRQLAEGETVGGIGERLQRHRGRGMVPREVRSLLVGGRSVSADPEGGVAGSGTSMLRHRDDDDVPATFDPLRWVYHAARSASSFNRRLNAFRRSTAKFHDVHTGLDLLPKHTQPTRCRVVTVVGSELDAEQVIQHGRRWQCKVDDAIYYSDFKDTSVSSSHGVLSDDEDDPALKYPVALLPGQFQGAIPV
jgi:hypothetical protein